VSLAAVFVVEELHLGNSLNQNQNQGQMLLQEILEVCSRFIKVQFEQALDLQAPREREQPRMLGLMRMNMLEIYLLLVVP
jgi:hypothetical protein